MKGRTSPRGLETAANALHTSREALEEAYKSILDRIDDQSAPLRDLARKAIAWIVCAKRELSVEELREAVSVDAGDASLDARSFPDIDLIIDACAGLVTIHDVFSVQYVGLAHYTTTEFFRHNLSQWSVEAHEYITEICATYMFFDLASSCKPGDVDSVLASHRMLEYVHQNWSIHYRDGVYPHTSEQLFRYVLDDHLWHELTVSENIPSWPVEPAQQFNGLHLAAQKGLSVFVRRLMYDKKSRNYPDQYGRTPLSYAAEAGHLDVVRHLTLDRQRYRDIMSKDSHNIRPVL